MNNRLSINTLTKPLVQNLISRADALRIGVTQDSSGVTIVDAGIQTPWGIGSRSIDK